MVSLLSATIMILVVTSRRASAFLPNLPVVQQRAAQTSSVTQSSRSKLMAATSFLQDLQKNLFSSMSSASSSDSSSKYFTIGLTGANGLVGTALRDELSRNKQNTILGKPVRIVKLARGDIAERGVELGDDKETALTWNPNGKTPDAVIDPNALKEMDAIVHLSGENVATGLGPLGFLGIRPWTDAKKEAIISSRLDTTTALAKAIASKKSKPTSFLVASGIGVYGNNFIGDELPAVDESMDVRNTNGFLADMARQWEAATAPATTGKNRVVNMRFGVVLSKNGGALAKLYPIFFLGGGGNVGSGDQYFTFISARDIARAIVHTLETPSIEGPVNFSAPQPCTNAEFTKAFGSLLARPTILPLPAFVVSLMFGEMGEEMLLGGVRAIPGKLLKSGFRFEHPTIETALKSAVEESI